MDVKEEALLGKEIANHWYYQSKAAAVRRLLGNNRFHTLLDVGAGSGFYSRDLVTRDIASRAYCIDTNYGDDRDEVVAGKPISFRKQIEPVDADLVLMMDVLEHVENHIALLSEQVANVKPGTIFLISVPAFQFIWSKHDEFLGHYRRYTLRELEDVVTRAGLRIDRGAYYFASIFPFVALVRLWQKVWGGEKPASSDLRHHSAFLNVALTACCTAECRLLRFNRAFGLTAFCLARRI